jgi:hypothetical protein
MQASRSVSDRQGIIAWLKNAGGDTARLVVPIAIPVHRSMEPTGHGAASNIGQPIPTLGVQATTTLSESDWVFRSRAHELSQRGCQPDKLRLASNSKRPRSGSLNRIAPGPSRALLARD